MTRVYQQTAEEDPITEARSSEQQAGQGTITKWFGHLLVCSILPPVLLPLVTLAVLLSVGQDSKYRDERMGLNIAMAVCAFVTSINVVCNGLRKQKKDLLENDEFFNFWRNSVLFLTCAVVLPLSCFSAILDLVATLVADAADTVVCWQTFFSVLKLSVLHFLFLWVVPPEGKNQVVSRGPKERGAYQLLLFLPNALSLASFWAKEITQPSGTDATCKVLAQVSITLALFLNTASTVLGIPVENDEDYTCHCIAVVLAAILSFFELSLWLFGHPEYSVIFGMTLSQIIIIIVFFCCYECCKGDD